MVKWQWRHRSRACVSRTSTSWRCGQGLIGCDLLDRGWHGREQEPALDTWGEDRTGAVSASGPPPRGRLRGRVVALRHPYGAHQPRAPVSSLSLSVHQKGWRQVYKLVQIFAM